MRKPVRTIDIRRLREVLDYGPVTGLLHWRMRTSDRVRVGDQAGCVATTPKGKSYITIRLDGVMYLAHRLAWAHHYGEQPPNRLDHWDGDGTHNWISNLRGATQSQNMANMRKTVKSATGFRGVYPSGSRFCAKGMKDGVAHHFGSHATAEGAYAAYCAGMKTLFGDFVSVV